MAARRDVSPIIQKLREFLLRRESVNFLRFKDDLAPRTQPPPNLPEGPNQKLAQNYYYSRDSRRIVKPDNIVYQGGVTPMIEAETKAKAVDAIHRTPGRVHMWDS